MSLVVTLVTLAEGAAPDARGNLTLIAANPNVLVAEQLPAQFFPTFYAAVEEDKDAGQSPVIVPGRMVSLRIEATGPDGDVVYFSQLQQVVAPPAHPSLPIRLTVLAQVPFTASKIGEHIISARITITAPDGQQDETTAIRKIPVVDSAFLKAPVN